MKIARPLAAEFLGTLLLLATVVGSGVMAERLAAGNNAVALLGNTAATGAVLYVLITLLGPISGAHFNPVVSLVLGPRERLIPYVLVQLAGALCGVWLVHLMFDMSVLQWGVKTRAGPGQWVSEGVATFGLLLTVLLGIRHKPDAVPALVALWIVAGYWFTASTSFANPAVTIARALTDSFAGIRPADVPAFMAAQIVGALLAWPVSRWLALPLDPCPKQSV
jgi:glycerol uptake facilitator-like aquaporin